MQIYVGDCDLVHSATIIPVDESPSTIILPDEVEGDFTFVLHFISKPGEKIQTKIEPDGIYKVNIYFINFNAPIVGNTAPIEIGTLKKLPLLFMYRVVLLQNSSPLIHVNFYTRRIS
jgi:hypothetical protein